MVFNPKRRSNQRKEFDSTKNKIQEAERKQIGLQRRADKLKTLQTQLDEALKSTRRLPLVRLAIDLENFKNEHDTIMEKIATLPKALADLSGQELDQIEQFQNQIVELEKTNSRLADSTRRCP